MVGRPSPLGDLTAVPAGGGVMATTDPVADTAGALYRAGGAGRRLGQVLA